MSDFQISDFILSKECDQLAADIFAEVMEQHPGEDPEDYRDEMQDRAHESADGHEWVIYTYKAIMLCAHCDVSEGEAWLEETGNPPEVTFGGLAACIAYGEMTARIGAELNDLIEAWEAPEETDAA